MANQIRTSKADYMYTLEGITYASNILKNRQQAIEDSLKSLSAPGVLSGETGEEMISKLKEAQSVVTECCAKFNRLADVVYEQCRKNGIYLDTALMVDFEESKTKFAQIAERVSAFKGGTAKKD